MFFESAAPIATLETIGFGPSTVATSDWSPMATAPMPMTLTSLLLTIFWPQV